MGGALRVFLSHTRELNEVPAGAVRSWVGAAEEGIKLAEHAILEMKGFSPSDRPAADVCVGKVKLAQVFIIVMGHCYGTQVRDRSGISYTELEFDTALAQKKTIFAFLLDEAVDVERDVGGLQPAFRRKVRDTVTTATVSDVGDLQARVVKVLRDELPDELRGLAAPVGESVFDVDELDPGWHPNDGPPVLRPDRRYRLDALVALTSRPFTLLLADPRAPGSRRAALADTLDAAERAARPVPARRWFALGDQVSRPGSAAALAADLLRPDGWADALAAGERVGLVLPLPPVSGPAQVAARRAALVRTLEHLRAIVPRVALVVHASAASPYLASLLLGELGRVDDGDGRRAVALLWSPAERAPDPAPAAGLVQKIVAGNETDIECEPDVLVASVGAQDLRPGAERDLLRWLRAARPASFPDVLAAHAQLREGAACAAGLAVAAETVEELSIWWHARMSSGWPVPSPREVPPELRTGAVVSAVAIEMMARGCSPAEVAPWVAVGSSQLRQLLDRTSFDGRAWSLPLEAGAEVAPDLAAVLTLRLDETFGPDRLPAKAGRWSLFWALAGRTAPTPGTLRVIGCLPEHLAAVVGDGPADDGMADVVDALRDQLPHLTARRYPRAG